LLLAVVAAGIILLDHRWSGMQNLRSALDAVVVPVYWVANMPMQAAGWFSGHAKSRSQLIAENAELRARALILQGRAQQMAALRAENVRLRSLLNSSTILQSDVLVAELIGVVADRQRHLVILNKGSGDGVYIGQPLLDADGLMGQIVQVSDGSSRALLISDVTHSVPLQVNRNAVRVIAEGIGLLDTLELRHVVATTDIEVGDLLVTSGLGGRFPAGYPVATVASVERDPGQAFARVTATPTAALNRSRHVLLVFSTPSGNERNLQDDEV
jgi:rod shape-determining protein MreC